MMTIHGQSYYNILPVASHHHYDRWFWQTTLKRKTKKHSYTLTPTKTKTYKNTYEIPEDDRMIVDKAAALQTPFTTLVHQHLQLLAQDYWTQVRHAHRILDDTYAVTTKPHSSQNLPSNFTRKKMKSDDHGSKNWQNCWILVRSTWCLKMHWNIWWQLNNILTDLQSFFIHEQLHAPTVNNMPI